MKTQNNLKEKFSQGTIIIHWLTALLILSLFPMGKYMYGLELLEKTTLLKIHAIFGIIVLILTIIRSVFFFTKKRPADLKTGSKLNDKIAIWIHNIFYFLLFGIGFSGLAVMVTGGYVDFLKTGDASLVLNKEDIGPMAAHGLMSFIMMVLLLLHVLGVVKHYFFTKENTLKRIF